MSSNSQSKFKYKDFIAGLSGGVMSSCILHPLDLTKIRFSVGDGQKNRPKYNGYLDLCRSIVRKNGVRGLYAGVGPSVVGAGLSWGCYFFFFGTLKTYFNGGDEEKKLKNREYLGSSFASGIAVLLLTNPIWVAKTRMCLQYESQEKTYKSLWHTVSSVYKQNGIRGFYKGFTPGLLGTSHGAIQFFVYERMKHWNRSRKNLQKGEKNSEFDVMLMSSSSKFIAATTTYPYQVVRSRLQDQHRSYNGVTHVIASTFKHESWKGFYKGLTANLLRVIPASCITFITFETVKYYL